MDAFDTFFTMALGVFLMFASVVSAMSIDPPYWTLILGIAGVVCFVMPMIAATLKDSAEPWRGIVALCLAVMPLLTRPVRH